jgi:hypothetical protein
VNFTSKNRPRWNISESEAYLDNEMPAGWRDMYCLMHEILACQATDRFVCIWRRGVCGLSSLWSWSVGRNRTSIVTLSRILPELCACFTPLICAGKKSYSTRKLCFEWMGIHLGPPRSGDIEFFLRARIPIVTLAKHTTHLFQFLDLALFSVLGRRG